MTQTDTGISGRALAGLAVGAAAASGAIPAIAQDRRGMGSPTSGSWMDQVMAQHRMVDQLFAKLKATRDRDRGERTALLKTLAESLTAHSIAEETVLYPAIAMMNQTAKSDELYIEQSHAKVILAELDNMPKEGPEFLSRLGALEAAIKAHVADEEGNVYPRLMQTASPAQNAKMSDDFRKHFTKYVA